MQNLIRLAIQDTALEDRLPVTIASRTRRVYDLLAGVYPISTMLFHSYAHRCALQQAGIHDGMNVLEIATGSGEMFRRLVKANPGGVTVGLDLSPNMAARTQHRVKTEFPASHAGCHAVDARHLPFRNHSFDAIVCCYLLELLSQEDISQTLAEIHRVLRPGGTFTLTLIGQNRQLFNRSYELAGSILPSFWGRQIESKVPDFLEQFDLRIEEDCTIRQIFYPSRVLTARK